MAFSFGAVSRSHLVGVHPDLVRLCEKALELSPIDFRITCGARTLEEQEHLVHIHASRTLRSRHIPQIQPSKMAEAIDFVPLVNGQPVWSLCFRVAEAFKEASHMLNIPITWGGDWKHFEDTPHIELFREKSA